MIKISYWFQEDVWIRIYFQIFLAILITSRLLVAEQSLKIPQRIIKIIISFLVAFDTLNLFNLVLVETVFKSEFLLYTVLSITSLSLFQFSFLFIGDTLYPVFQFNINASEANQIETNQKIIHQNYFDESAIMYDNNLFKSQNKRKGFLIIINKPLN